MTKLNFPTYNIRQKTVDDTTYIWDIIRKKWLVHQPEEWVRQNLMWYLIHHLGFPKSLMSVEKQITLNKLKKRYDIVVYNTNLKPVFLVECKAPSVKITQAVFNQIAQYNITLNVPFLLVSNGLHHYLCEVNNDEKTYQFHREILNWSSILKSIKNNDI